MMNPSSSIHRWARLFGWTTLGGLLCGLIGPYGSFIANPISRVCFWISIFWVGTSFLWPSVMAALRFAERRHLPILFVIMISILAACVPLAIAAWGACSLFWPVHASGVRPQEWYVLTFILATPATALALWLEHFRFGGRLSQWAPVEPSPAVERAGRLPDHLISLILCLQMEDHHVRVYTAGGSSLYLAAMRDVVSQLGTRGLQVHRSWWVAHEAVSGWTGDPRALELTLANGIRVPVARNRVAAIRAAGWLDRPTGARALA